MWASKRETTRIEDQAYCLLGIFDINMPLLYGEGTKAFKRLQEEIVRKIDDLTIFVWKHDEVSSSHTIYNDLLAPSPRCFRDVPAADAFVTMRPPSVSSRGVNLGLCLVPHQYQRGLVMAVLGLLKDRSTYVAVWLLQLSSWDRGHDSGRKSFVRVLGSHIAYIDAIRFNPDREEERSILVHDLLRTPPLASRPELALFLFFHVKNLAHNPMYVGDMERSRGNQVIAKADKGKVAGLVFTLHSAWCLVIIGLNGFGAPWCEAYMVHSQGEANRLFNSHEKDNVNNFPAILEKFGIRVAVRLKHLRGRLACDVEIELIG